MDPELQAGCSSKTDITENQSEKNKESDRQRLAFCQTFISYILNSEKWSPLEPDWIPKGTKLTEKNKFREELGKASLLYLRHHRKEYSKWFWNYDKVMFAGTEEEFTAYIKSCIDKILFIDPEELAKRKEDKMKRQEEEAKRQEEVEKLEKEHAARIRRIEYLEEEGRRILNNLPESEKPVRRLKVEPEDDEGIEDPDLQRELREMWGRLPHPDWRKNWNLEEKRKEVEEERKKRKEREQKERRERAKPWLTKCLSFCAFITDLALIVHRVKSSFLDALVEEMAMIFVRNVEREEFFVAGGWDAFYEIAREYIAKSAETTDTENK